MAATAAAPPAMSPSAQPDDSNISSPLSEVDDKDANDEDIDMHLDGEDDDEPRPNIEAQLETHDDDGSDSESALSDARSVAHSDANDTEAETERLYDTPQNQRQRDVVFEQENDTHPFENSPSKLRSTAVVDEENDQADDSIPDGASSVSDKSNMDDSPIKKPGDNADADHDHLLDSQERKRKRSPATDRSDSEQPLRKRTGSVGVAAEDHDAEDTAAKNADAAIATDDPSANLSTGEEAGGVSSERQEAGDNSTERETRASKKMTRSSSRRKGSGDDVDEDTAASAHDDGADNDLDDELQQHLEAAEAEADADAEAEEEADAAARSAEEAERKQAAFKDWSRIEEMFGVFRDRLYSDRLQRLEQEEQSLLADEPTHREYLNMKKCLDDRLEQKLQEINKEKELRMMAHQRRSVAIHAQIWGQFAQAVREKREAVLEALNREWYDVQTARRNAHSVPDRGLIFPKDPAQRIRNAVAYNTEVSTLAGIAKYEGFPAGPDIKGASVSEVSDDLSIIEQARRSRQRPGFRPRDEYQTPSLSRLGPAGEQFLKETPWANPNHSAHKVLVEDLQGAQTGTGQQAVPVAAGVDGPISQQRSPAPSSRTSQSPELTRSALKSGTTMKRAGNMSNPGRESKAAAA